MDLGEDPSYVQVAHDFHRRCLSSLLVSILPISLEQVVDPAQRSFGVGAGLLVVLFELSYARTVTSFCEELEVIDFFCSSSMVSR